MRYGQNIIRSIEIYGISHLIRKMLIKIIISFAHCKRIYLGNLIDIGLKGEIYTNENFRIEVNEEMLTEAMFRDMELEAHETEEEIKKPFNIGSFIFLVAAIVFFIFLLWVLYAYSLR